MEAQQKTWLLLEGSGIESNSIFSHWAWINCASVLLPSPKTTSLSLPRPHSSVGLGPIMSERKEKKVAWEVVGFIVVLRVPLRIGQSVSSCQYVRVNSISLLRLECLHPPSLHACLQMQRANLLSYCCRNITNPPPTLTVTTSKLPFALTSSLSHFSVAVWKAILWPEMFLKWWNRFNRLKASLHSITVISDATAIFFFKREKHAEIIFI